MSLVALLTGLVAVADVLSARWFNLGPFYIAPLIVATQYVRRSSRLLLLATLVIALNYAALVMGYWPGFTFDSQLRFRLINRTFVAASLGGAAALMVGYLRVRDYWLRRQVDRATTDGEVSFVLQIFQLFEDLSAVLIAGCLAAVTLTVDLSRPQTHNLAILYLIPLAVLAMPRSRWLLWTSVPVLIGCTFIGFYMGVWLEEPTDLNSRLLMNREVACAAMVVAAAFFQFTGATGGRARRAVAGSAAVETPKAV